MKKTYTAIFPKYMKEFICTGPACTDNCCRRNWMIDIDKNTYNKYRNFKGDKNLSDIINKTITRNRKKNNLFSYARIKLRQDFSCPMLDERGLCSIHAKMGISALSFVCRSYPRMYYKINGRVEYSATLSCPEVTKMVLLNPNGIEFVSEPLEIPENTIFAGIVNDNMRIKYPYVAKYFFDIQATAITIMQYRKIDLEKRLILLGSFSNKIMNAHLENTDDIERIINDFSDADYLDLFIENFLKIETRYMPQLIILFDWGNEIFKGFRSQLNDKYIKSLKKSLSNIYKDRASEDEILERYKSEGIEKYMQLMREKSYILENYIVNTIFEDCFPINTSSKPQTDIFSAYMKLIMKFIVLRTTIIGLLIGGEELNDDNLVDLIQGFSQKIHHNPTSVAKLTQKSKSDELYSLAGAVILLNL